jgi:hypothetical protein
LLSCETHSAVKRSGPFLTARARFDSHCVRDLFYRIAKTYLFLFDEAGETNAIGLPLGFTFCWFFFSLVLIVSLIWSAVCGV